MTKKVHIPGSGQVSLSQKDFIASGGEGEIYGLGDTIYKIYHSPKKMIPQGKFDDLSVLDERHIVNPQRIIMNSKNIPIGFTMEWFKNNLPICKVFTSAYRKKAGFKPEDAVRLVENMQKLIDFVHSKECLIVDFNDINFLIVSNNLVQPIFIDVDSYKTKNYPPTAITPYAQDHHSKDFSRLTDWYSFAIIAFQIFVGMHPFKGSLDGFQKGAVIERMKANKSVFNKKAKTPPAARDLSHIPSDMRSWMEDIFEKGKRKLPPMVGGRLQVAKPSYTKITSGKHFDIDLVKSFGDDIGYHFSFMNENIIRVGNTIYVGRRAYNVNHQDSEIIISPDTMTPVEVTRKEYRPLSEKDGVKQPMNIEQLGVVNNTIIAKMLNMIISLPLKNVNRYILSVDKKWSVMPLSTKIFPGMIYQDVIGKPYIMIPREAGGSLIGEFIFIPELEGYKVVSAKCIKNVAVIIGYRNKQYCRFILRSCDNKYDIRMTEDIGFSDPNFTVLDKGIAVILNENSQIEIFKTSIGDWNTKVIEDKQIDESCILSSNGSQVLFYKGKDLYKLRMGK